MTTNGFVTLRPLFSDLYIYLDAIPANHFSGLTEDHFLSQVYSFFLSFLSLSRHGRLLVMKYFAGFDERPFPFPD